jgi:predicted membrane protein
MSPEQRAMGEPLKKRELFQQILSIYILFGVIYAAAELSDAHLFQTDPLIPSLLYSFVYVHNTVHIQVAHVTKEKFVPWTRVLIMNMTILGSYLFLTIYQRYVCNFTSP